MIKHVAINSHVALNSHIFHMVQSLMTENYDELDNFEKLIKSDKLDDSYVQTNNYCRKIVNDYKFVNS